MKEAIHHTGVDKAFFSGWEGKKATRSRTRRGDGSSMPEDEKKRKKAKPRSAWQKKKPSFERRGRLWTEKRREELTKTVLITQREKEERMKLSREEERHARHDEKETERKRSSGGRGSKNSGTRS